MYVKITDGIPVPTTLTQLKLDHPNVSFPETFTDALAAEWGLLPLQATAQPDINRLTEDLVEGTPALANGTWMQVWQVLPLPQEEAERRIRTERDRRLAACDWVVIRAKELGQSVPIEWFTYRGDLRQVPEQTGFPYEVAWPTLPA
jgi:hypothetical protein